MIHYFIFSDIKVKQRYVHQLVLAVYVNYRLLIIKYCAH